MSTKRKLKTVRAKSSAFVEERFPEDLIEIVIWKIFMVLHLVTKV